jgi:hypothetical protein
LISHAGLTKELSKLHIEDLKDASFLLERINAARLSTLADIADPHARGSMLTRATGQATQGFSQIIQINRWNDLQKGYAATVTQNRILKALVNKDKSEMAYLSSVGIDRDNARVILQQFRKHGTIDDRAYISGQSKWDMSDPAVRDAKRVLNGAMRKEADTIVVTKGIADAPIVSNSAIGKLPFQFTGFLFGAHQRMLLRGLQQQDVGVMMGVLSMVAMGMVIAGIKAKEAELSAELSGRAYKREKVADWSTEKWLYEGIDRSGVLGLAMDGNNRFEKLGGYGLSRGLGISPAARYNSRGVSGVFLGPAAGNLERIVQFGLSPLKEGGTTDADRHAARLATPGQNIPGFRHLLDMVQGSANEQFK